MQNASLEKIQGEKEVGFSFLPRPDKRLEVEMETDEIKFVNAEVQVQLAHVESHYGQSLPLLLNPYL